MAMHKRQRELLDNQNNTSRACCYITYTNYLDHVKTSHQIVAKFKLIFESHCRIYRQLKRRMPPPYHIPAAQNLSLYKNVLMEVCLPFPLDFPFVGTSQKRCFFFLFFCQTPHGTQTKISEPYTRTLKAVVLRIKQGRVHFRICTLDLTGYMSVQVIKCHLWEWRAESTTPAPYDQWSHFLLTWSEATGVLLYLNGKLHEHDIRIGLRAWC